ncbi:MAG: G1 family glutamic endopeptidase, partial [Acidimicrobiales bacterium]
AGSGTGPWPAVAPDPFLGLPGRSPHLAAPRAEVPALSRNWSGKVATGATFSQVSGEWTVPTVRPSAGTAFMSAWVGIGGANGNAKLVQTGTTATTFGGGTTYRAWYELLPAFPVYLTTTVTVQPGDTMSATVEQVSASTWSVSIENVTLDETYTRRVAYTAGPATTAEWIAERPTLVTPSHPTIVRLAKLADFGSVTFTHMEADGTPPSPASVVSVAMTSTPAGTPPTRRILAYPGPTATATTGSFTDTYGAPQPTVTGIAPSQGPATGGTGVTVTGDYLLDGLVTSVRFGAAMASFTFTAGGALVATAPPGSGTVDVTVATTGGTTAPAGPDQFTYVGGPPPPPPAAEPGYDLVGSDGGVFVFPPPGTTGGYYGSLPGLGVTPAQPVVGMVPTVTDRGYFLVGADGGVFAFGTAPFLGSLPAIGARPAQPVTGIVAADTDRGYFLVGADGGVFAFGTVPFLGSLPGDHVSVDDVIGIAATPGGTGYWLVTATGTVYAFGTAQRLGTARGTPSPVSAIAGTPTGGGYWITTRDGAVYAFGNAVPHGTLPALHVSPALPVVGLVNATAAGGTGGYWLIGADGGVFAFGTVPYVGSLPGLSVHVDDVVGAVPTSSSA